jgi:hypothetical protein
MARDMLLPRFPAACCALLLCWVLPSSLMPARSPGFERTAELLRKGTDGAALAAAALSYGQDDEITVLPLTMASATEALSSQVAEAVRAWV